ncbi:MAG: hypothetical protein ACR2J3_13850 [Aridibacter sp.]
MAVQNLEVTTESILSAFVEMPEKEFEQFIEEVKKLRQKPAKSFWTKGEIEIIQKINECVLSAEKQERYDKLVRKRQNEKITESEMNELIALTDETEENTLKRVELLVKLAKSKGESIDKIMERLEICPPQAI